MVTYTVLDTKGQPLARNLSPRQAAHELLTWEGRGYDILPHERLAGFVLWTIAQGGPFTPSGIISGAEDEDLAREEIFAAVIAANRQEHGLTVVDDADYDMWLSGFENE